MHDAGEILIEIQQVGIGYAGNAAKRSVLAEHLSLAIRKGEIIGLVGRNGCGKSTLLRSLARMQAILEGSITISGKDIRNIPRLEFARMVSFVSTEMINIPHITVAEMVSLGRFPYTNWVGFLTAGDKSAIRKAVDITGIHHLRTKLMHELSDGERQRVMIARALAQDTSIIILDEPTAFLDLPTRFELLRLLNQLAHQNGKTVLYSTHDLNIALHESDKLWLMAAANVTEGAPEDLIITKGFLKLFENSGIHFDMKTTEFRLQRDFKRHMTVSGDPVLKLWTTRALERIGIGTRTDNNPEDHIAAFYQDGCPVWNVRIHNKELVYNSIYDLASNLRDYSIN